jgi:hypothetical protein
MIAELPRDKQVQAEPEMLLLLVVSHHTVCPLLLPPAARQALDGHARAVLHATRWNTSAASDIQVT